MGKDTDRDILEKITDLISACKTLIETINDNKYVPHIVTQPVDYTGSVGDTASFTVLANNVKEYQWQYRVYNQQTWNDSDDVTASTNSFSVKIKTTPNTYNIRYRCKITGLDNSIIYTNEVKAVQPEI